MEENFYTAFLWIILYRVVLSGGKEGETPVDPAGLQGKQPSVGQAGRDRPCHGGRRVPCPF